MNDIDILFWNYRGYGFSEGSADFTNSCEDILTIYDHVMEHFHYNKIAVHGLSIGGLPASYLASRRNINLIIADRTFGSVDDIINSFPFANKFIYYLAKILFFPFVDNKENFMKSNCKKILMNDPEDRTIIDTFSLKTSISKKIINELFQIKNPELNIRKIKSDNILDYALDPEQSKELFAAFKYTINFLKNKSISESNNNQELILLEKTNINSNNVIDEKAQKLTENNININSSENLNVNPMNTAIQISLKDISDTFYSKIKMLYSKFNSCGD
jgi:esterase/lipase